MNLPSGLIEKESPLKIMRRFRDSNPLVLIGRLNERTTTTNWSITSAFLHLHKSRDWSLLGHQKSFSFLSHLFFGTHISSFPSSSGEKKKKRKMFYSSTYSSSYRFFPISLIRNIRHLFLFTGVCTPSVIFPEEI